MNRQPHEPIYKHLDLPVKFVAEDIEHYRVPPARDEAEDDRRENLAHGTIILERQSTGLSVASLAIKLVNKPDDIDFMTYALSTAGVITAWYTAARKAEKDVMRRVLDLPDLTALRPEYRRSSEDLRLEASCMLGQAVIATNRTAEALQHRSKPSTYQASRRKAGRIIGDAALMIGAAELGDYIIDIGGLGQADTQNMVRQRGLANLESARNSADEFGTPASMAQLADPYSDVSVYFHKHAPNGAMDAIQQAWEIQGVIKPLVSVQ